MKPRPSFSISTYSFTVSLVVHGLLSLAAVESVRAASAGKKFSSPEEAVRALSTAVNNQDTNALTIIFGPLIQEIKSPDPVQARNEFADFAARFNISNHIARVQNDRCTLEIGEDQWPFAIPIVRANGAWFFDTEAGKQEIL